MSMHDVSWRGVTRRVLCFMAEVSMIEVESGQYVDSLLCITLRPQEDSIMGSDDVGWKLGWLYRSWS